MKINLMKILADNNLRFQIVSIILTVINSATLMLIFAPQVRGFLISRFDITLPQYIVSIILICLSILGAWYVGYILDTKYKYFTHFLTSNNVRNKEMMEILENTKDIKKMLRKVKK